jgi:hypothetical protein
LTAALVIGLTFTCVQRAYASVVVPNHLQFTRTTGAAFASESLTFSLPESNSPVLLSATCTTDGFLGTLNLTIARDTSTPAFVWSGVDANGSVVFGATNADELDIADVAIPAAGVALQTETTGGAFLVYENEVAGVVKTVVTQLVY